MMPWRTYLARVGVAGIVLTAAVFVGVRLATADPGGPTSPNELTYSGVLRNRAGTGPLVGDVTLMFTLRRTDGSSCPPVTVSTIANANGAFSAPVSTRLCPSGFFNGDQISYDVSVVLPSTEVGPLTPDGGVAITPVPYARFADQAGVNNDCPVGYELDPASPSGRRYCRKLVAVGAFDDVVRVGSGPSAFWIDRYESMICAPRIDGCGGLINNRGPSDLTARGLPPNGRWVADGGVPPVFAVSLNASNPPARWLTWFQADALCRAAGKRLPTGSEWLAAARGTGGVSGDAGCLVRGAADARDITEGSACASEWGAQDMVGNVAEWTADWFASAALDRAPDAGILTHSWPTEYGSDNTYNITSLARHSSTGGDGPGLPSAALRGGTFNEGPGAGIFELDLSESPAYVGQSIGFRCVIPR